MGWVTGRTWVLTFAGPPWGLAGTLPASHSTKPCVIIMLTTVNCIGREDCKLNRHEEIHRRGGKDRETTAAHKIKEKKNAPSSEGLLLAVVSRRALIVRGGP